VLVSLREMPAFLVVVHLGGLERTLPTPAHYALVRSIRLRPGRASPRPSIFGAGVATGRNGFLKGGLDHGGSITRRGLAATRITPVHSGETTLPIAWPGARHAPREKRSLVTAITSDRTRSA